MLSDTVLESSVLVLMKGKHYNLVITFNELFDLMYKVYKED